MGARGGLFSDFAIATSFLTRVPMGLGALDAGQLAQAGWAFPLVGIGVGALAGLVFLIAALFGCGDWPSAVLAVLAAVVLTGALHEDGLADTADGFAGGANREAKLRIMRDSRHGTFGVLALFASFALRMAALAAIGEPLHVGLALIAAHAGSRGLLPASMRALPPARSDGLGIAAGRPRMVTAVASAAIGLGIALAALGPLRGVLAVMLAALAVAGSAALARRQIGGYTGDVLGAFQQIGEIVILLAGAAK